MRRLKYMGVAAALVMATLGLSGTPAQAAAPSGEYVALGDSYASGVGAGSYSGGTCLRSAKSYPQRLVKKEPGLKLKDATCSGATIADVRDKQLASLSSNTKLVTLTVGGNDAQFRTLVEYCLTQSDFMCESGTSMVNHFARNQMVDQLAALYGDIKKRAPQARIIVLGYPWLVEKTGSCGVIDLSADRRTWMNGTVDAVAEGTTKAAGKAGVEYLDMRFMFGFGNHGACGSSPWINGVNLANPTETFHPNATGYDKAYAYAWDYLFE